MDDVDREAMPILYEVINHIASIPEQHFDFTDEDVIAKVGAQKATVLASKQRKLIQAATKTLLVGKSAKTFKTFLQEATREAAGNALQSGTTGRRGLIKKRCGHHRVTKLIVDKEALAFPNY